MSLFGAFDDTLLNRKEKKHYQTQTASYIEDFYNDADGSSGLLDAIKSEIRDVKVVVKVVDQEFQEDVNDRKNKAKSKKKAGKDSRGNGESTLDIKDLARAYTTKEKNDDESYLPEFAVPNDNLKRHNRNRILQTTTDVKQPCVASSSDPPLALANFLEIRYKRVGPVPDGDLVISFPFSAVEFRENYINNLMRRMV